MAEVGEDPKDRPTPTPYCGLVAPHQFRLPRGSSMVLGTFRNGALTTSLGSSASYLTTEYVLLKIAMYVFIYRKQLVPKSASGEPACCILLYLWHVCLYELEVDGWSDPVVCAWSELQDVREQGSQAGVCGVVKQIAGESSETMGDAAPITELDGSHTLQS